MGALNIAWRNWSKVELVFWSNLSTVGAWTLINFDFNCQRTENSTGLTSFGRGIVPSLSAKDFNAMDTSTCAIFASFIEWITDFSFIPYNCMIQMLSEGKVTVSGIRIIPSVWLEKAGSSFIGHLNEDHLNSIPGKVFESWISSGHCHSLDPRSLSRLKLEHWLLITPECIKKIPGFKMVNLPARILGKLRKDIFSKYKGELHRETTKRITPAQVKAYTSQPTDYVTICVKLCIRLLSSQAASAITPRCLERHLIGNNEKPVKLENQWSSLERPFGKFTELMMRVVAYINPEDYKWMSRGIVEKIFTSPTALHNLPNKDPELTIIASSIRLLPHNFKFLVNNNYEFTCTFIVKAKNIPDDLFALFEAEDYYKLGRGFDGNPLASGDDCIVKLSDRQNFGRIVANLSRRAKSHYCENLRSPKDYQSRIWLRENSKSSCWKALPFRLDHNIKSLAPELDRGDRSWLEYLKSNPERYKSFKPRILQDLMQMSDFCKALSSIIDVGFLERQPDFVLCTIREKCAVDFYPLITPMIAKRLAGDAFRLFTAEMFIGYLKLTDLTPIQVGYLSEGYFNDAKKHVFNYLTPKDLLALDEDHLRAVTPRQFQIYSRKFYKDPKHISVLIHKALAIKDNDLLLEALKMCEYCLGRRGVDGGDQCDCVRRLEKYLQDPNPSSLPITRSLVKKKILEYKLLGVTLAKDPADLIPIVLQGNFSWQPFELYLSHDPTEQFDLSESLFLIRNNPEDFAHPRMSLFATNFIDAGAPQRTWIEQLLLQVRESITEETNKEDDPTKRKFVWVIGDDAGFLTGLLFGKALQKNVPLPFELEEDFWKLLINPNKVAINNFYDETFKNDRKKFCYYTLQQDPLRNFEATQVPYIHPDALTFNTLDLKSNLYTPNEEQVLSDEYLASLTRETIITDYFARLDKVIRNQFHQFVGNFLYGLSMTLHTKYFSFIRHVPSLTGIFKAVPLSIDAVLKAIKFDEKLQRTRVRSLLIGHKLSVSNIIKSYIMALNLNQLRKFIKICTGVSILPKNSQIHIIHSKARTKGGAYGHFWTDPITNVPIEISLSNQEQGRHIVIGAGNEYKTLVRNAAKIQSEMLKLPTSSMPPPDPFDETVLTAHDGESIKSFSSSCFRELLVYPQAAGALIHSLAVLTNMNDTDFLD